jgi:hypothetical protein
LKGPNFSQIHRHQEDSLIEFLGTKWLLFLTLMLTFNVCFEIAFGSKKYWANPNPRLFSKGQPLTLQ